MKRLLICAVFVGFVAPVVLTAQADPRLESRVDMATLAEVRPIMRQARRIGLPVEPLIDKVLEGTSRGASRERIIVALERLYNGMKTVSELLGDSADPDELAAGALALRAGATEESISSLNGARPGGDLTTPFGVLADLVAMGVPPEMASMIVASLTSQGNTDGQLLELYSAVVNDIRAGYPPVIAASVRSGIPTAAPPPFAPALAEGVARPPEP